MQIFKFYITNSYAQHQTDLPKSTSYTPYNYNVQNADVGGGGPAEGGGMNILALICGPFCKGTPFESIFSEGNEQNPPNANQTKAGGYIGLPPGEKYTTKLNTNLYFYYNKLFNYFHILQHCSHNGGEY